MQAVILAAGESSRFWPLNKAHKSQIKLLGESLVNWTLKTLVRSGIKEIVLVCSSDARIKEEVGDGSKIGAKISYIIQDRALGTGDAVFRAKDFIREPFFILHPYKFYAEEIMKAMVKKGNDNKSQVVLAASPVDDPQDYGVLRFEGNVLVGIDENPSSRNALSDLRTLGIYFLQPEFFRYYQKLTSHREEDLIDALNLFLKEKKGDFVLLDKDLPTLKYPWDLFKVLQAMFESENFKESVAASAVIGKNVVINGKVYIGENVKIGENTVINGHVFIGDNCEIGANNVLRGPVNLEKTVKTGAFCEIKNTIIQEGTHLHSGYFGDSIIGKNCRFGAGFVSANKKLDRESIRSMIKNQKKDTGLTSFGAVVGSNTRFGVHCSTMPGVLIGSDCIIGPGTVVFENIEDNTTFYTKFEKVVKKNE
ncbi:MAG: bifunctional sugar-1-phosphate nucleotidylyltransferase/acetyltransferase [Candidatus Nealsonbacteria bacterium]